MLYSSFRSCPSRCWRTYGWHGAWGKTSKKPERIWNPEWNWMKQDIEPNKQVHIHHWWWALFLFYFFQWIIYIIYIYTISWWKSLDTWHIFLPSFLFKHRGLAQQLSTPGRHLSIGAGWPCARPQPTLAQGWCHAGRWHRGEGRCNIAKQKKERDVDDETMMKPIVFFVFFFVPFFLIPWLSDHLFCLHRAIVFPRWRLSQGSATALVPAESSVVGSDAVHISVWRCWVRLKEQNLGPIDALESLFHLTQPMA